MSNETFLRFANGQGGYFYVRRESIIGMTSAAGAELTTVLTLSGGQEIYCDNKVDTILDAMWADVIEVEPDEEQAA